MKATILSLVMGISATALYAQNVGIGTGTAASKLTVNGNTSIGTGYKSTPAPANGAIIEGRVGIGTTAPNAKLHVNGNMILGQAAPYYGNNASSLVRDNATGEIKIAATNTNNFPINYKEYILANVDGDWVKDYDTRISIHDYVVVVVGSSFDNPSPSNRTQLHTVGNGKNTYNPFNVFARVDANTNSWHLSADYKDGDAGIADANGNFTKYNGTWYIRCLIINKTLIKTLNASYTNFNGSNTAAEAFPPDGL